MTDVAEVGAPVAPQLVAALLLAAGQHSRLLDLPCPSVEKILAATGASRSRAYDLRDALLGVLPSLQQLGKKSGDVATALRFCAVALLGVGKSSPEVADSLHIAISTVVRAAHAYLAQGIAGLYDKRRKNGRPKADPAFRARVTELLRRTPEHFGWSRPTWTRELLCRQVENDGRAAVSVSTVGRVLAAIGARLGMPKPVVLCPWKRDAREARLAEIRALEKGASAREPVLYSDEVDIHLNPKIGRDWMLPGEQRRIVTPGKNEKFYLAGALDVRTGELITTGLAHKGAALFCQLLRDLSARYGR